MTSVGPDPPVPNGAGGRIDPSSDSSTASRSSAERRRQFSPFVNYGVQRGIVETLLGLRGIALAAILGAEWFGAWSLARIGHRYAGLGDLGLIRGLEVEASARGTSTERKAADFARATLAWFMAVFGTMSACAAVAAWLVPDDRASAVLGGLALGVLIERVWLYATSFMRARGLLSHLGWCELVNASLHLVLTTGLAFIYGIWGAFIGFLVAHLIGLSRTSAYVPLRPHWSPPRVAKLARIGFPITVSQFLYTLMTSVDRLVVGIFLGIEVLGYYAFAVAVSSFGAVIGFVFRTVLFPGVFRMARRVGPEASIDYLDLALFPFAWLFAPLLGLAALAIAPAVELWLPEYAEAVPAARIFMFIGIVQGLNMVVQLGVVAHDRQHRLPLITGGAVMANLVLALGCVTLGLGLEVLATAALVTRLAHVMIQMLLVGYAAAWRDRLRVAARILTPILVCGGLVFGLSRIFDTTSASGFGLAVAAYVAGLAVLVPGIIAGVRAASTMDSAAAIPRPPD